MGWKMFKLLLVITTWGKVRTKTIQFGFLAQNFETMRCTLCIQAVKLFTRGIIDI